MIGRSYLTATEANEINGEFHNALATFTTLSPVTITLYRGGVTIPAQTVAMRYRKDRAPKLPGSDAAASQQADGAFVKEVPFNVALGDVFTLASGQRGTITMVPAARIGIQRAEFVLDEGTPA